MEDNLQMLRDLGAHKIHNDTHISREFVQAIIHESFEDLHSVQFFGFISILEKTYGIDLSELRAKGKAYFSEQDSKSDVSKKVFVVAKEQKSNTTLFLFIGILVFLSFLYYSFVYVSSKDETTVVIDSTKIENVQKKLEMSSQKEPVLVIDENKNNDEVAIEEVNTSEEAVTPKQEEINEAEPVVQEEEQEEVIEVIEPVDVVRTLKILPKRRIWAGYINIATNQKYQKVFKKEFALDTDKDWLLLFGKGTAYLEVNGEVQKFSSDQNMRFKYVNGKFEKITVTEFKILNKGSKW